MTTFFTSDTHFGHKGILEYCARTRPFASIEEHDEELIRRWNCTVTPRDTVWHLGDFCWNTHKDRRYHEVVFSRLNGKKHLVIGNHDHREVRRLPWVSSQWAYRMKYAGETLWLSHYPVVGFRETVLLHGHTHGNRDEPPRSLDVGVDVFPGMVTIESVMEWVKERHYERRNRTVG